MRGISCIKERNVHALGLLEDGLFQGIYSRGPGTNHETVKITRRPDA